MIRWSGRIAAGMALAAGLLVAVGACGPTDVAGEIDAASDLPDASGSQIDGAANQPDADPAAPDAATNVDAANPPDADPPDADPPDADPPDADPSIPPEIVSIAPATGSTAGGDPVQVIGNNFTGDIQISFGLTLASCTFQSSTLVECTTPSTAGPGWVVLNATQTSGDHSLPNAFLYCDTDSQVDDCHLVAPTGVDELATQPHLWKVHVRDAGFTDASTGNDTPPAGFRVQYGYGPEGTDPVTAPGWTWLDGQATAGYGTGSATYEVDCDEYQYDGLVPPREKYVWAFRASVEAGASWRFCGTGTITSRSPISCTANNACFTDELCLSGRCRLDCTTASECLPWGPYCGGIGSMVGTTDLALYCVPGNAGGGTLGADCASNSQCESGLCLVDLSDTCTVGCGTNDGICGASAGRICTELSDLGFCVPSCDRNADCNAGAGQVCVFSVNALQAPDRVDQFCSQPFGAQVPGDSCLVTNDCGSGMCLIIDTGVTELCTSPCIGPGDCPGNMPVCGTATYPHADGGETTINVCSPS